MKRYNVGMFGGSFNPLHNGHVKCIKMASRLCNEIHIIIGDLPNRDDFNIQTKMSWFREVFKNYSNIYYHIITDPSKVKSECSLAQWIEESILIKKMIGKPLDVVFCGEDYNRSDSQYKVCYPECELYFISREDNISSTRFRSNPIKYKNDVPACVFKSYMTRIPYTILH